MGGILGDVSFSKVLGIETFPFFRWFRIRYRKNLVSKKVSDSVSKKFGIEKSIGFGIGKNFGFGFVQILGIVTHWFISNVFFFQDLISFKRCFLLYSLPILS